MTTSTARDHFLKAFDFQGRAVRCVAARRCQIQATYVISWRYDKKLLGRLTECVQRKPACEKHARLFAFKHDLKLPRSAA